MTRLASALAAQGCEVWVLDLPGFGLSDKPRRTLDVPNLAGCLAGWLRAIQAGSPVVIGNSFGTQVVAALAAQQPEMISRLVLVAPTIDTHWRNRVPPWILRTPRASPPESVSPIRSSLRRAVTEVLIPPTQPIHLTPPLRHLILTEYAAAGPIRALSTYRHALADSIEDRLPSITRPLLVARGDRDGLVSRAWAMKLADLAVDGSYVEIPGVTHDAVYEDAEAIVKVASRFIMA